MSRPASARVELLPTREREESESLASGLRDIYRAHFPLVWRSLRRLGVPRASLEDAVQDVFLVVHRRSRDFEQRSSLTTWIYGIALRVAKDYRRAEARHTQRVERLAQSETIHPSPAPYPDEEAERREANQLVQTLLAQLAEEDRELLVLIELEQLSVREAASALGIGVRTCQRHLQRARAAFDEALALHARRKGVRPGESVPRGDKP